MRPVPLIYRYVYEGGTPQVNQEGAVCPLLNQSNHIGIGLMTTCGSHIITPPPGLSLTLLNQTCSLYYTIRLEQFKCNTANCKLGGCLLSVIHVSPVVPQSAVLDWIEIKSGQNIPSF